MLVSRMLGQQQSLRKACRNLDAGIGVHSEKGLQTRPWRYPQRPAYGGDEERQEGDLACRDTDFQFALSTGKNKCQAVLVTRLLGMSQASNSTVPLPRVTIA